ncbi:MAG: universal stress protein [Xanthobacteraceae bacterium]
MIKDIIVSLQSGEDGGPAGDYAISLASAFEAHIAGVAFVYAAIISVSAVGYIPREVIDVQLRENEAAAKAAIGRFNAAVARTGVSAEPLLLDGDVADASRRFSRIARYFDVAVVGQPKPEASHVEAMIGESTLFEAGRPVIMVPYVQRAPVRLEKVMVCWDGGGSAARAVGDAMPLLKRARKVEIVIIAHERGKPTEIEGVDLGRHLARHGLNVAVERIPGGDINVGEALLSRAADSGADLMVMGGYGHSRLREFVLGGVTRSILHSMTVPVLMSH